MTSTSAWQPSGTTVRYTAERVWDGQASAAFTRGFVDVVDGVITAVGRFDATPRPPEGPAVAATSVMRRDLGDVTLMPGLINAHVHLVLDSSEQVLQIFSMEQAAGRLLERGSENLRSALSCGVTTVRDLGAPSPIAWALREAVETGDLAGPSVIASGSPLTTPGGHCHFLSHELAPHDDAAAATEAVLADGADLVKVFASGGNLTPGSSPLQRQFDSERLAAIVAQARRHARTVAGHAHGRDSVADCVRAGVHTVEHCTFDAPAGPSLDRDVVAEMLERATIAVPTVNHDLADLAALDLERVPEVHRAKVARLQAHLPRTLAVYRQLADAGVAVACGTDAGIPHATFDTLPQTIAFIGSPAGLGMSPVEALRTATSVAARACGVADRGALAPGLRADLLAVAGNPLERLDDLAQTRLVVVAGREVWRRAAAAV